ncbi:histidine kinase dimerization/phosphoacceptor domain -containing protein [Novosphingobium sp. BL-52-GroH]|uniref:histidine kinase dimerization/phosphoacceptor domain -containing protein n=1 Tax=Novosphingobium sp. BL-52-GroH TaxID=3349877 RepID=UPI0038516C0E
MDERDDWHLTDKVAHETGPGDPFAAAVRATRMPMVITDPAKPDNPIVFCNEAFQKLTGYAREEIIGRNCRFLQGPDTDRAAVRRIHDAIAAANPIDLDLLNYRKDGTTFWNALYLSPVRNKAGDIQFFFASQLDVTDRIEAQRTIAEQKAIVEREVEKRTADLTAALDAKTLLLHEVDHRVKNNLTMIGSLLRLQARTIADPAVSAKLEAMLERIDALATVHRRLYQSDDIERFDIGAFCENLVADVVGSSGRRDIITDITVDRIEIPAAMASALGLVLNEILTNAIKHAFADGRGGKLSVLAIRDGTDAMLTIADDGPGFAGGKPPSGGLGTTLISRLAKQAGAQVTWISGATGTRVDVQFEVESN